MIWRGVRALLLALAAVFVAAALGVSHGNLDPLALTLVLLAIGAAAGTLRVRGDGPPPERWISLVLGAGLAAGFAYLLLFQPGWHATHALMPGFRPLVALAAGVTATHLWTGVPAAVARSRPPLVAALWLGGAALVFGAYPAPSIDVWTLQQEAVAGLVRGDDPYALAYVNPYGPGTPLLAPSVLSPDGGSILAFPYPPLTLLTGLPAFALLGDVRWAHAALTLLSAAGIWLLGRRSRAAELAATLVLFQPNGFFLVEQAWTEPLVLASLVGLALALDRAPRAAWVGLAAGLALGAKQYTPLLLVPFLAAVPARERLRAVAVALAVAGALYLPFLAWDPVALWRSLVSFHLEQPFRRDSLSLAAAIFAWTGEKLPAWPGFLVAGLVVAAGWRGIRGPAEALAVAALAWLAFLALGKQAFANYYGLAVGLLAAAVALAAAARETRGMQGG